MLLSLRGSWFGDADLWVCVVPPLLVMKKKEKEKRGVKVE